jgi:hypothetical protein
MKLYFLRSKLNKSMYIHPTGDHVFQSVYGLKEGKVGACCFTEEQVKQFLVLWDEEPIEKEELKK